MNRDVYIVAHGARTPVGLRAESSAAAARAGICRYRAHPFLLDSQGETIVMARDARLAPDLFGVQRLEVLCREVEEEVWVKLLRAAPIRRSLPLLMALPEVRPGFAADADRRVLSVPRSAEGRGGPALQAELVGRGHAGGLLALALATQRIAAGGLDVCLVGGADSYCDPETLEWLEESRQLKSKTVRSGFTPGEGAALIVLASRAGCRELGLPPLALVRGVGSAHETKAIKADAVNLGEGLAQALVAAMQGLQAPREAPDEIYCDINGERFRSEEWGFALLRMQHLVRGSAYQAPANCWGDVGAASGPLLCILAVQSWSRRYAGGPRCLVWCGSESGARAAVVLEAAPAAQ